MNRRVAAIPRILIWLGATAAVLTIAVFFGDHAPASATAPGLADPSALEVYEGSMMITEDGAVIENLEIRGRVEVLAKNVVMRNVWVYANDFWTILVRDGGSLLIEDSEIGNPNFLAERGIGVDNVVARNVYIHHVEDGIKLGSNSLYDGVRVDNLASPNSTPHADALQADGGASNSIVRNSVLDATGPIAFPNAAVFLKSDLGPISNITLSGNYFNGGAYIVFVRDGGNGMPTGITINNNRIGSSYEYGLLSTDGPIGWFDNVWADSGEPAGEDSAGPPPITTTAPSTTTTLSTTTTSGPNTTEPTTTTASTTTSGATGSGTTGAETPASPAGPADPSDTATLGAEGEPSSNGGWLENPQTLVFAGLAVALLLMLVLAILGARDAWAERQLTKKSDRDV